MADNKIMLKHTLSGQILYHYTKSNGINGILTNKSFWATKSDFLNDPKEFKYIRDIVLSVSEEYIKNIHSRERFLEDAFGGLDKNMHEGSDFFVLSFSTCRDSITMWSEFGNRTGYNIGFESDAIIKRISERNTIDYHGFVVYKPERQKELIRTLFEEKIERIRLGEKNRHDTDYLEACSEFAEAAAVYAMFFKYEAFSQEQEYRFVFKGQKDSNVLFREKDGFMIPYIQVPITNTLLPVVEIMVAPNNHIDLAKSGIEYMLKVKGYKVQVALSDIKLRY